MSIPFPPPSAQAARELVTFDQVMAKLRDAPNPEALGAGLAALGYRLVPRIEVLAAAETGAGDGPARRRDDEVPVAGEDHDDPAPETETPKRGVWLYDLRQLSPEILSEFETLAQKARGEVEMARAFLDSCRKALSDAEEHLTVTHRRSDGLNRFLKWIHEAKADDL